MSADILEYVDQKFRSGNSVPIERAHLSVDEWAQLRAEIGRLRGEVAPQSDEYLAALDSLHAFVGGRNDHPIYREFLRFVNTATIAPADVVLTEQQKADRDLLLHGTSFMRDGKRIDPTTVRIETPAPAEAKGDREFVEVLGTNGEPSGYWIDKRSAPQPADGGAVAPVTYGLRMKGSTAIIGVIPQKVHDHPPSQREYLEKFEEVPLYTHPSACDLEAVPCDHAWRRWHDPRDPAFYAYFCDKCSVQRDDRPIALQHRGDSQEVGRG